MSVFFKFVEILADAVQITGRPLLVRLKPGSQACLYGRCQSAGWLNGLDPIFEIFCTYGFIIVKGFLSLFILTENTSPPSILKAA